MSSGLLARIVWRRAPRFASLAAVAGLAVGVAAVASVRMLAVEFEKRLRGDARQWLAADIAVHTKDWPSDEQLRAVADFAPTLVTECITMARSGNAADPLIISLKAVDPSVYPYYGAVMVTPPLVEALGGEGAVVSRSTLERLRVSIGQTIRIGSAEARINGVIEAEPDRYAAMPNGFERVIVSRATFDRMYQADFGASTTHRLLFRGSPDPALLQSVFRAAEVTDYRDADPAAARALEFAAVYLYCVAGAAFLLAILAFAATSRLRVEQRLDTTAILRCLGARRSQWFGILLAESAALSTAGTIAGLLLAVPLTAVLARKAQSALSIPVSGEWQPWVAAEVLPAAILVSLCAAWTPMRAAARMTTLSVFRRNVVRRRAIRFPRLSWMPAILRCAIRNLVRPDFRSGAVLFVLTGGATLLSAIHFGRSAAAREILQALPEIGKYNLFVVGASRSQVERATLLLDQHEAVGGRTVKRPLAWLRLRTVDGRARPAGMKEMWFATCEDRAGNGSEWPIAVSSERARLLGLTTGSRLTFATAGGDLRARVNAVHRSNTVEDIIFGFVFPCRAFESLAVFYYGGARVAPESRAPEVRRWLAAKEPATGTLSAEELVAITERVAADAFWMLDSLSMVALAGGMILLALIVASTERARSAELAIYRTLGARPSRLLLMLTAEFALLGALAWVCGVVLGGLLSSAVISGALGKWSVVFGWWPAGTVAFVALVTAAGVAACVPLLRRRPMDALRDE